MNARAEHLKCGSTEYLMNSDLGNEAIARGEILKGWRTIYLGELTDIAGGTTPHRQIAEYWKDGSICWATPTDITSIPASIYELFDTKEKVSEAAVSKGGSKIFPEQTVLMTSRATIGHVAVAQVPISTNQGFANFLPSEKYVPQFLCYWLESKRSELIQNASGSTFKEISKRSLKGIQIILPPFSEQECIAEILSSVDDCIRATEAVIAQAKRVKRGLMEDLLTNGLGSKAIARGDVPEGWRRDDLITLVTLKRGYDLPVSQRIEGDIPVVASNGPVGTHNQSAVEGPVVVTGRSGTIGKVELYEHDCHPLNTTLYSQNLHGNDARYVVEFLRFFRLERFATGTSVSTLNRNLVHAEKIVIPPVEKQKKIAGILLAMDDYIAINQRTSIQLRRLKRGLMDDLLTGRVRTAS